MNQITNLSQQKPNLNDFRNLAFEVSCHLDQLAAFMLQASCLEEHQDEIKASCMAKAVSKTSLIIFNKTLLIIDQMEELLRAKNWLNSKTLLYLLRVLFSQFLKPISP